MNTQHVRFKGLASVMGAFAILFLDGCSKSGDPLSEAVPRSPAEAASQLQTVFKTAAPELKQSVSAVTEAMRKDDYEKAVVSLQIVRSSKNLTLEQGLAIHNSEQAMRRKILSGVEAGDENAKRAFQLLKELKRN
jgi:PBP1b-binding outer membrane lipoprotein LpoB